MEALKLELAARKRAADTIKDSLVGVPNKKYRRRGEIEHSLQRQKASTKDKVVVTASSNSTSERAESPATHRLRSNDEETRDNDKTSSSSPVRVSLSNANRLLRALDEPVRYFGETDEQQQRRLRKLQIQAHDRGDSSRKGGAGANPFQKIQQQVESEILAASVHDQEKKRRDADADENAVIRSSPTNAAATKAAARFEKYHGLKTRNQFDDVESYILHFFKRLVMEWEIDLLERPEHERRSMQGRQDSAKQKQTRQYIKPLFKLLKQKTVAKDIIDDIEKIVDLAVEREYVKANDWYLRMSIGNAAWPMGVTSVGIHERAGRTKIFADKVAHVLNDENQRKYIQSIKRLLTFAQQKYPNVSNTANVG